MYPRLLELPWTVPVLGQITIYTYGVLLAAAYLLGLQARDGESRSPRARQRNGPRPRHLHHHQRARRRKAAAARDRFPHVPGGPETSSSRWRVPAACSTAASFSRSPWRSGTSARAGLPLWTTCDAFAPGIALGHVVGRFGCFFAGCCYGKDDHAALGHYLHGSLRGC